MTSQNNAKIVFKARELGGLVARVASKQREYHLQPNTGSCHVIFPLTFNFYSNIDIQNVAYTRAKKKLGY